MNVGFLILAVFFALVGWWKLPNTLAEARSPLAPYRAVAAVIYLIISIIWWCAGVGVQVAVVVAGS